MLRLDVTLAVVVAVERLVAMLAVVDHLGGVDRIDVAVDILFFDRSVLATAPFARVAEELGIVLAMDVSFEILRGPLSVECLAAVIAFDDGVVRVWWAVARTMQQRRVHARTVDRRPGEWLWVGSNFSSR